MWVSNTSFFFFFHSVPRQVSYVGSAKSFSWCKAMRREYVGRHREVVLVTQCTHLEQLVFRLLLILLGEK